MTVAHKLYLFAVPLAALTVLSTGCPEPEMKCRSAQGPYGVRYEGSDAACVGDPGNVMGLRTYNPGENAPDFDIVGVGLQVMSLGSALDNAQGYGMAGSAEDDDVRTFALFESSDPDGDGLCYINDLGSVSLQLPEITIPDDPKTKEDETFMQPAMDVEYSFSDVAVLATPAAQGLQFEAQVDFTDNLAGCSSSFTAIGLYPEVGCATDEDCAPSSGISSDFPVRCDTSITVLLPDYPGVCVLDGDVPAYN